MTRRRPVARRGGGAVQRGSGVRRDSRPVRLGLGFIAIVVLATLALLWSPDGKLPAWPAAGLAPVQRVLVEGPFERVSPTEVENAVLPRLRGGFFTADLAAIRAAAESLPWVASAQVLREWPDRVRIVVSEQQPAWLWGDDGLLNGDGELFVSGLVRRPQRLPRLDGPPGSERVLVAQFREFEQALAGCAARVARLELDARRATRLTLAGGIELRLGRAASPPLARRFCDVVLDAVAPRLAQVAYVDLRYTNGFAVGWQRPDSAAKGG